MTDARELIDLHATDVVIQHTDDGPHRIIPGEIVPEVFAALRDIVKLHKPNSRVIDQWTRCYHCNDSNGEYRPWPCPTVQAIHAALEVPRG